MPLGVYFGVWIRWAKKYKDSYISIATAINISKWLGELLDEAHKDYTFNYIYISIYHN